MPSLDLFGVEQTEVLLLLVIEVESCDGLAIVIVEEDGEIRHLITGNNAVRLNFAARDGFEDFETLKFLGVVTMPPSRSSA